MNNRSMPYLAIFDHDGVLVDSLAFHVESWLELGRLEGLPITEKFVRENFGRTNPDILRGLIGNDLDAETIRKLGDLKERCYREIARPRLTLMEGVREVLDAFRAAEVALAIGSSGPRANLELTVEVCGLEGRFVAMAALEDVARGKPDPEVFLVASRRAEVPPERCVVFEDAPFGIEAARAAGMRAVGVGTTHSLDDLRAHGAHETVLGLQGYDVVSLIARLHESEPIP